MSPSFSDDFPPTHSLSSTLLSLLLILVQPAFLVLLLTQSHHTCECYQNDHPKPASKIHLTHLNTRAYSGRTNITTLSLVLIVSSCRIVSPPWTASKSKIQRHLQQQARPNILNSTVSQSSPTDHHSPYSARSPSS